MALLMPLSVVNIHADTQGVEVKIPLKVDPGKKLSRDLTYSPIESYYYDMLSVIRTSVATDIGDIKVTVTNCSTGESWSDTFDSSQTCDYFLYITSASGFYEIVYITEAGERYEGEFSIE